jgi:hypothetical protein
LRRQVLQVQQPKPNSPPKPPEGTNSSPLAGEVPAKPAEGAIPQQLRLSLNKP